MLHKNLTNFNTYFHTVYYVENDYNIPNVKRRPQSHLFLFVLPFFNPPFSLVSIMPKSAVVLFVPRSLFSLCFCLSVSLAPALTLIPSLSLPRRPLSQLCLCIIFLLSESLQHSPPTAMTSPLSSKIPSCIYISVHVSPSWVFFGGAAVKKYPFQCRELDPWLET